MRKWLIDWASLLGQRVQQVTNGSLDEYTVKLNNKLIAAGEPPGIHGHELLGLQIVSSVLFPIVWCIILKQIPLFDFLFSGPHQLVVVFALIVVGFLFPSFYFNDQISKRHRQVSLQLPDVMDLLTICVEAGLDFIGALRTVVSKQKKGALKDELERFLKQLELGKTRMEGLRELSARLDLPDLTSVTASLIQADKLGSPLGPVLRTQSDMIRTRRGQKAEKAAMEATVKMLAPLLLCIFPAVFIMILGPVIIQMMGNMN